MEVTLRNEEWRLAQRLATRRSEGTKNDSREDKKVGPQSDRITDLNGIVAELASAKALNCWPDMDVDGPKPSDLEIFFSGSVRDVDVKGTKYQEGKLLVPLWKEKRESVSTDLYLLVTIVYEEEGPTCQLVGWQWADFVYNDDNVVNLGHGPTFGVDQEDLLKPSILT